MKEIDYLSLIIEGIDYSDAPDFCDAFIAGGTFEDGTPLDDDTLDELNEDTDLVYEAVLRTIY